MSDGNFIGQEYDPPRRKARVTSVWESVAELNSAQAAGPFGKSEQCALTKTIEYYTGTTMPAGTGQPIAWAGTSISAGSYISGARTYTWKGAGPVNYDMVYTSNAWGQPEKTYFIDSDDSTTRSSARLYAWRQKLRRVTHPDDFPPFR